MMETFIPTMIQSFIDNTYTVLQEFQTDYLFKEPQKMGKLAHRLLGSCRTFKMTEISNYLEHIEEAGINQDWDLVQKSYLSVMPLFIKVLEQLKNIK